MYDELTVPLSFLFSEGTGVTRVLYLYMGFNVYEKVV